MQRLSEVKETKELKGLLGVTPPADSGVEKPTKAFDLKTLTIRELHQHLNYAGYICDESVSSQLFFALKNRPVKGAIVQGVTGAGKTFLPQKLAEISNASFFSYQCQLHTDETDLIQKLVPYEETKSGIKLMDNILLQAIKASKEGLTIVCIDEYDKSRPSADTVMLEFLQRGGIFWNNEDHQGVLDNMIVFICCNKERELSEFIQRRMCMVEFRKLNPEIIGKALLRNHKENKFLSYGYAIYKALYGANIPKNVSLQEIVQLIQALELHSKEGMDVDWGGLIYQFISKHPELHKDIMGVLKTVTGLGAPTPTDTHSNQVESLEVGKNLTNQVDAIVKSDLLSTLNLQSPKARFLGNVKLKAFKWDNTPKEKAEVMSENKGGVILMKDTTYAEFARVVTLNSYAIINPSPSELWVSTLRNDCTLKFNVEIPPNSADIFLTIDRPFNLRNALDKAILASIGRSKSQGEVIVEWVFEKPVEDFLSIVKAIQAKWNSTRIVSMSKGEVHIDNGGVQSRLTSTAYEIILPIDQINNFIVSASTIFEGLKL